MLRRDWRAGELNLLLIALVLAVAALASVSFLADRMHAGLEHDARQLLGADVVVVSDLPLPPDIEAHAASSGLRVSHTATFPSMASALAAGASGEPASQLAAVKAVDAGYPLRGTVKVSTAREAAGAPVHTIPEAGTVWVDPPCWRRWACAWARPSGSARAPSGSRGSSPRSWIAAPVS